VRTFARRALPRFKAIRCGVPVPITRDAALWTPLFTLAAILGFCFAPLPKSPCSSLAWLSANRCAARCCLRPRGDSSRSSLSRFLFRLRPQRWDRLSPKMMEFSGLWFRFRASTLHLAALVSLPFRLLSSCHYTSERLTGPYSGEFPVSGSLTVCTHCQVNPLLLLAIPPV
jgi:hypothetical protein